MFAPMLAFTHAGCRDGHAHSIRRGEGQVQERVLDGPTDIVRRWT